MAIYSVARPYGNMKKIDSKDLLDAVKYSVNLEGDLYQDRELVVSWLTLSMEENIERLHQKGIETYLENNRYGYRYVDESLNKVKYSAQFLLSGDKHLDVTIHDYYSCESEKQFWSFSEIFAYIKAEYKGIEDYLSIWFYDVNGATRVVLDEEPAQCRQMVLC